MHHNGLKIQINIIYNMAAGKLYKDIPRLIRMLKIIEQYNNYRQLGAIDDIIFLRDKTNNLYHITDTPELIKEFNYCVKMISMYFDEIEPEFKKHILKEELKDEEELNN